MRLTAIALAWLIYFALHSLLADSGCKAWVANRWPQYMPGYRLGFNVFSVVALGPILWLVYGFESAWVWQWSGNWAWLANLLTLTAVLLFFASARAYDMDEFFGVRQLKEHVRDDRQSFTLSAFHRFVRHPWYFLSLILIWSREMNKSLLVSAVLITLYIFVGARLEERKLLARYGAAYREYMQRVPGLIPSPWKYLTVTEADALICRSAPAVSVGSKAE